MTDYATLVTEYLTLRKQCDIITAKAKELTKKRKVRMGELEAEITNSAQEEGLENIKTTAGVAYWSTHYTCTLANPEVFFNFVRDNEEWHLMERRAAKKAVQEYVENNKDAPPGVNFAAYKVFNVREERSNDK